MKIFLLIGFLWASVAATAQITTPEKKANFGVDADLRSNYFNFSNDPDNDDWFTYPSDPGNGIFIIDTTGAASILSQYATDANFRQLPFFRTMRYPQYSVINNRTLIDAVFIRDYHGSDSTAFANGCKNGMSPGNWTGASATSVPNKNELLDVYAHVRREGPDATYPLWLMGAVSLEGTSGDRYFDFEMYQSDIFYDRNTLNFSGYGNEEGHTSWTFDSNGNVITPGDIIFSAHYGSSSLSDIEARIWVDKNDLSLTPTRFKWSGSFDGASNSSQYGYAGIEPLTSDTFYSGIENSQSTWAGPFGLIRADNSLVTDYQPGQLMEFSVNLTQLGLDPVALLGGSVCGMPFRRILVKTRASTSFTSSLKDFVGPFDFFLPPQSDAAADVPLLCNGMGISNISVSDPLSTSTYTWSTPDGYILGTDSGSSINVDSAGMYIVEQRLQPSCPVYASDTVYITSDPNCALLDQYFKDFDAIRKSDANLLHWASYQNKSIRQFIVERSFDGKKYAAIAKIEPIAKEGSQQYDYSDLSAPFVGHSVYYRIKAELPSGNTLYSNIICLNSSDNEPRILYSLTPNPAQSTLYLTVNSKVKRPLTICITDLAGRVILRKIFQSLPIGQNKITIAGLEKWNSGMYLVQISQADKTETYKLIK